MPSEKILNAKKAIVSEIAEDLKASKGTVVVATRGLTVEEDTELRNALRAVNVKFVVRKNTLSSIAAKNVGIEGADVLFKGPSAIATCDSELDAARVISKFAKDHEKVEIKGGISDGKVISADEVKALANIPSREVLIARMLGCFTNGVRGLTVALNEIAKKQSA